MNARTVIKHALNQGPTPARLVMISAGEGTLMEIDSRELPGLRAQGVTVDVLEVVPSTHIASLSAALRTATEARAAAEMDVRNYVPGAADAYRAADLAEMDAYLALFDARHASAPVGVSLVKVTDGGPRADYADCGHSARLGLRGDFLHTNSLPLLAVFFGSMSDGGFVETV